MTPVTLASASASRAAILAGAGVSFSVVSPGVDEEALKASLISGGAGPRDVAEGLAARKALAVAPDGDGLVIGADQTLELDGGLMNKAGTVDEARDHLAHLRGREHQLHTAVAVARAGTIVWSAVESPRLRMRAFTDAYLDAYLARRGQAILSSVGCYHLEGEGAQLFERVEGDYFAILGLPLIGLLEALRREGALPC